MSTDDRKPSPPTITGVFTSSEISTGKLPSMPTMDSSSITLPNPGFHSVLPIGAGGISISDASSMFKTIAPEPNVFSKRIAMQTRLSEMDPESGRVEHIRENARRALKEALLKDAPTCFHCPHVEMLEETMNNHSRPELRIMTYAKCGRDMKDHTHVICPNGRIASRDGSVTYETREIEADNIQKYTNPAPEFSKESDEPYIRIDPDRPQSSDDTAW